jgi:hypothetical protein
VQKLQGHTPGQPVVADSAKTETAQVVNAKGKKEVKKQNKS